MTLTPYRRYHIIPPARVRTITNKKKIGLVFAMQDIMATPAKQYKILTILTHYHSHQFLASTIVPQVKV